MCAFQAFIAVALMILAMQSAEASEYIATKSVPVKSSEEPLSNSSPETDLAKTCVGSRVMSIIAHADDDLYFINPSIDAAIQRGACVHTVIVTEGYVDDPNNRPRIEGLKKAYEMMMGGGHLHWQATEPVILDKSIQRFVAQNTFAHIQHAQAKVRVELSFLNLPAGSHDDLKDREPATLYQLFAEDSTSRTGGLSPPETYTEEELIKVLSELIRQYDPDTLYTLNPFRLYPVRHSRVKGEGAHPDHVIVAKLTMMALIDRPRVKQVWTHDDYSIQDRLANLNMEQALRKTEIMKAYCRADPRGCADAELLSPECANRRDARWGEAWLCRHYPQLIERQIR